MAIDDDVIMPPGFDPQLQLIKDEWKMIAYPIRPSNDDNYLTRQQRREYRKSDRHNYFKSTFQSTLAPHGAISVTEIDTYLDNMMLPPVDGSFIAEDQKKGHAWRRSNYLIAMAGGPEVETEVPDNCSILWQQRVASWDLGAHLTCPVFCADLNMDCPRHCGPNDVTKCLMRKSYQFQRLLTGLGHASDPSSFGLF